jgi:dihydrofolate reductase
MQMSLDGCIEGTINPIILGKGKSLFKGLAEKHKLNLVNTTHFNTGVVAMYYQHPLQ